MTGRLHIDVTSVWQRKSPPVGISRVVAELAATVQHLSDDNQAWRYDFRDQSWREFRAEAQRLLANV